MSYSTFGYGGAYANSGAQLTGAPATSPGSTGSGSNLSPSCGESSAASAHNPAPSPLSSHRSLPGNVPDAMGGHQGQQQLDSSLAALSSSYPRLQVPSSMMQGLTTASPYPASYPSTEQNPYPSLSMESSPAFYGSLTNPYMKSGEGGGGMGEMGWGAAGLGASLPGTAGYYAGYDHPSLAAYGYGGGYDLAARRKNATRESTATLKAWLNEHKKNPYPTKGEKIMLAIITKMTLTQVSTWFANARRRLKKENKMTWEPKNKLDDEDVDVSDDDDRDHSFNRDDKSGDEGEEGRTRDGLHGALVREEKDDSKEGIPIPPSKPKIWSMAELAVCKTPPPLPGGGQAWQHGGSMLGQGYGLDPSLVRQPMANTLRNNMFGMEEQGRGSSGGYQQMPKPELGDESGMGVLGEGETPPQTPPHPILPYHYQQGGYGGGGGEQFNSISSNLSGSMQSNLYSSNRL